MTGRDRIVIIVLGALAVLAAVFMLLVSPEKHKAAQVSAQAETARSELSSARTKLAEAQQDEKRYAEAYASIVSLTKLKPRRLKIDRQLVTPIVHSQTQRRLVQSIVDIGKSLDIEIVAEGVETMEHARVLRDLGCDILQGFVFAKPMPSEDLERFMSVRSRLAAS